MPFSQLSEFLDHLADRRSVARVSAELNRVGELAVVTQRIAGDEGAKAVFFEKIADSEFPAVANLFGTSDRLLEALDVDSFEQIAERISAIVKPDLPNGWMDTLQLVPRIAEVANWPPRLTDTAMSQQVVHIGSDVDLGTLPIPTSYVGESLPAISSGHLYLEQPATCLSTAESSDEAENAEQAEQPSGRRLVSRAAVQIEGRNSVLIHWTPHDSEWQIIEECRRSNRQLPVAIAFGDDPTVMFSAGLPLPSYADPIVFAGFLRQRPVEMAKARNVDLHVPANAEFILEGRVDPETAFASAPPVALSTGFLSGSETVVRATVTALTHRANPVLPIMIPAQPPGEESVLSAATQRILLPLVQLAVPEVVDLYLPDFGSNRNIAFASIRKSFPHHARKVMNALWGLGRLSTVKMLVVVDSHVDVHDADAVWFEVGSNTHPGRDTIFSEGPADMQDHAAPIRGVGHRMGIDATRKLPDENHAREWPSELSFDSEVENKVTARWHEYGIGNGGNG